MTHPSHRLYKIEELALDNSLAVAVIAGGLDVCKVCGEYESGLETSCAYNQQKKKWDKLDKEENKLDNVLIRSNLGTTFGKSTTIDIINNEKPKEVLIIDTVRGLHSWVAYLNTYYENQFAICNPAGNSKAKSLEVEKFLNIENEIRTKIIFINYESVWRSPFDLIIRKKEWSVIVLGNCERIKNPWSKVSHFICGLHAKKKIGVTSPHLCNCSDLYSIFRFLNKDLLGSYSKFRHDYLIMGGFQNYCIVGYKNQSEFSRKIKSIIIDQS
jgi:hypothetical protein